MRWSWPSWASIVLGVVLLIWGLVDSSRSTTGGSMMMNNMATGWGWLFLAGAMLLAAGLHALQASYDGWCGDWGGCGCCGDGCSCGDCGECGKGGCSCCKDGCTCGDCPDCGGRGGNDHGHEHAGHGH